MVSSLGGEQSAASGRHRNPSRSTTWIVAALVIALIGGAAAIALVMKRSGRSAAADCPDRAREIRVAAAPDIAPAVAAIARSVHLEGCSPARIGVRSVTPAAEAAALSADTRAARPDVWIPDSAQWLARVPDARVARASIARSPVVLAVAASAAHTLGRPLGYRQVADAATTAHPIVLALADPTRSAPSAGVLVGLKAAVTGNASSLGNLAALLQNTTPGTDAPLPTRPATDNGSPVAVPTSEQAVWAADAVTGTAAYTAIYPPAPGASLDYPVAVFTRTTDRDTAALLASLTGRAGRDVLMSHGFRSAAGASGPVLTAAHGVDPSVAATAGAPSPNQVSAVMQSMAVLRKPSRLLALIDVSGSMDSPVPGVAAGSTRIEIARTAAAAGLGLLPADSAVGLWRFSADLTSSTDYQQLVPVGVLDDATRGELAAAVTQLDAVPNGGTGLYDSILAAVRSLRAHFDPTRVNSVVVLTDGKDEADAEHGVALSTLLSALKTESASAQPVKVVAIAYGPDTDTAALRSITAASRGILYTSANPRDLPKIFRNAIGHRV